MGLFMRLICLGALGLCVSWAFAGTPPRRLKVGKIAKLKPIVRLWDERHHEVPQVKLGTPVYAGDQYEVQRGGLLVVKQPNKEVQTFAGRKKGTLSRVESKLEKDAEAEIEAAAKRSAKERSGGVIYPRNVVPASLFMVVADTNEPSLAITLTDMSSKEEFKDTLKRQQEHVYWGEASRAWLKKRPEVEVRIEFDGGSMPEARFALMPAKDNAEIAKSLAAITDVEDPVSSGLRRARFLATKGQLTAAALELERVSRIDPSLAKTTAAMDELIGKHYWIPSPAKSNSGGLKAQNPSLQDPNRLAYQRLLDMGKGAYGKRDLAEAVRLWSEALKIAEDEKWENETANCLSNIGQVRYALGKYVKALENHQGALKLREKIGNEGDIAGSLNRIGMVYYALGQYQKTLDCDQRALKLFEKIGNEPGIAASLNDVGAVYHALGQYQKALEYMRRALKVRQKIGNEKDIAASLHNIGGLYDALGQYERALDYDQKALKVMERIGNEGEVAASLNNMAAVYYSLGQYEKALDYNQRALKLKEKIGNEQDIAGSLNNIGGVYDALGQYEKALEFLQRGLKLKEKIGNEQDVAGSLNNIGGMYYSLGQYDMALDYDQRALKLFEKIGNEGEVAASMENIGDVYDALGQHQKTLEYFKGALKHLQKIGNERAIAVTLNNIGVLCNTLGQYDMALDYDLRALKLKEKIGNKGDIAASLNNIGGVYYSLGQYGKALDYNQRALNLREKIGNQQDIAGGLNNIGNVYDSLGQYEKALDYDLRALKLMVKIGNEKDVAGCLGNIGNVYDSLGQYEHAADAFNRAMNLLEGLMEQVGDPSEIGALQDTMGGLYSHAATVGVKQRSPEAALATLERGKGLGLARQFALSRVNISKMVGPGDSQKLKEAEDKLKVASAEQRALLEKVASATGGTKIFFERQAGEAKEKKNRSERDLSLWQAHLYATYPEFKRLAKPDALTSAALLNLSKSQKDTLFVEFSASSDHLLIFALRNGQLKTSSQDVKQNELRDKLLKYRSSIFSSESDEQERARELYALLLGPLEKLGLFGDDTKRIVFVADGPLLELPFAALIDSQDRRLIERFPVCSTVSLGVLLWPPTERKPTENLLVVADPTGVGGETFVSVSRGDPFDPLPGARIEGKEILENFGAGKALIGPDATEAAIKAEMGKYSILQFACHGSVNSRQAMHSALILAPEKPESLEDGQLEALEIIGIPLSAQLAVLSACETARGVASGGEGLLGLAWAFRAAGCPAVVASQWKVDDESSRRIMVRFYQELKKGVRKDDALREATLAEMRLRKAAGTAKARTHSDAYYWAAFQVIGDCTPVKPLSNSSH